MIRNIILCLLFLILVTSAENVELTDKLPSILTEEGDNVFREAIDLLQLEKIEHLKNQNEEAENKILNLEKEMKKMKEDHKTEIQKTVQVNAIRIETIKKDVEKLKEEHKKILQEKIDSFENIRNKNRKEALNRKAEIKLLGDKIKNQEIIVNFVFSVLRKGENMMKSKQNVIEAQSVYIEEKEAMLGQCETLQETVSEQKKVIETQSSKISELEKTITSNEQLKLAYENISMNFGEKNNCDISAWITSMAEGLTKQRENIDLLTSSMQHNEELESSCQDLKESFSNLGWESKGNSSLISHYQTLIQKQSETITMFRGMMRGFMYYEENGQVVYGSPSPCQCLPLPPKDSGLEVTSMKFDCQETEGSYQISCSDGKCYTDDWPECSSRKTKEEMEKDEKIHWLYSHCIPLKIPYLNATLDCNATDVIDNDDYGMGHKTVILEEITGEGVFRQEYMFPCLDCRIFEWSPWSYGIPGRFERVRGNNTIVAGSYQKAERETSIRLVGGNNNNTGNVYVTNSEGYHGPVCDDEDWNDNAATIVCKELGFSLGRSTKNSYFGNADSRKFAMDDVSCFGNEQSIQECYHLTKGNCQIDEVAGVICE